MSSIYPNVEATATAKWRRLKQPELATPAEAVILGNLEVLFKEVRSIKKNQELIMLSLDKSRKQIANNTSTGVDDNAEPVVEESEGQVALRTLKGEHFEDLFENYKNWIVACNRKVYTTRTNLAKTHANEFFDDLRQVISEAVEANEDDGVETIDTCVLGLIESLDAEHRVDLYMALGMQKRKEEVGQSKRVRPEAMVPPDTLRTGAARPKRSQDVVESGSDELITYSTDGKDIGTSRSSKRVRLTQSSDRGEDDDYAEELEA